MGENEEKATEIDAPDDGRKVTGERELPSNVDDLEVKDVGPPPDQPDELMLTPEDAGGGLDGYIDDMPGIRDEAAAIDAPALQKRLQEIESLADQGNWTRICEVLGDVDSVKELPPAFALVYGIARKEIAVTGTATTDTDQLAIDAMAKVLGVDNANAIALLVTKRALRTKRPWGKRKAPRAAVTYLILVLGISFGALAGLAATFLL